MTKFLLHLKRPLLTLLLWGLLLRLVLLFLEYSWDVNSYITWGKEVGERGISGFYDRPTIDHFGSIYPNYPPFAIYLFAACYQLYLGIKFILWQINILIPVFPSVINSWFETRAVTAGFMKLPAIIADLGIAALLYRIILQYKRDHLGALYVVVFFLFNPVTWYTSALWGQIESVPLLFILLSFYTLLSTDRKYLPLVLFTLALLSKQTSSIFIPVLIIAYLKKYSVISLLKSAGLSIAIFWILFIPFYQQGNVLFFPFLTYSVRILTASGIPFASNHAFNFWALITQWVDVPDTTQGFGISYRLWGYGIASLLGVGIFWQFIRRSLSSKSVYFTSLLLGLTVYMFFTRIHERHIQQALVFLIPFAVYDKKLRIIYFVISFIHMVNLYHNWSVPRIESLMPAVLSLVTVNILIITLFIIFGYLYYLFIRRAGWIQKDNTV